MALSQICQPCVQYKSLSPLNKPGTDILRLFCGNFGAVSTKGAQLERHKMRSEKLQSTKLLTSNSTLVFSPLY